MTIQEALEELGVRDDTLTDAERTALDRDGFLRLDGVLTSDVLGRMRDRIEALQQNEGTEAGKEVHQEAGTDRLANLVNKGEVFQICYTHPRVLAAIAHVLSGDLKLSSLNSRAALPGQGLQALHADWGGPVTPDAYQVCNSIWLLDDFSEENGATRLVPGTHRLGQVPGEVMPDPAAPHPDQVLLIAPAGTVVIFNSHTWHGGTLNRSTKPRRAIHSYFCRRDQPQQLNQRAFILPDTYKRLGGAARLLLDV